MTVRGMSVYVYPVSMLVFNWVWTWFYSIGAMEDMRSPQLPYLTQDLWTCDRKQEDIQAYTMETEALKVTITPQFAGKVWGIYDKIRERELLYANRAHQPANIGALKSWAAGGAEWNWSPGIIGHSAFSETEVFLTEVETEEGPMARVYEFDRYNGTVWQVDMLIVNDSFVAHPRITNPTSVDLRGACEMQCIVCSTRF